MRNDMHDIDVIFQHRTDRAVCVREDEDSSDMWFPLSQVEIDPEEPERGEVITMRVPEWLMEDKGLL